MTESSKNLQVKNNNEPPDTESLSVREAFSVSNGVGNGSGGFSAPILTPSDSLTSTTALSVSPAPHASDTSSDSRVNNAAGRWVYIKRKRDGNRFRLKSTLSVRNAFVPPAWKFSHVLIAYMLVFCSVQLYFSAFADFGMDRDIYIVCGNLLNMLLTAAVPVFTAVVVFRRPFAEIGMKKAPLSYVLGKGITNGVFIYLLVIIAVYINILLFPQVMESPQELTNIISDSTTPRHILFAYIFLTVVMAPVSEELFFRGFLYPSLKRPLGKIPAVIISGILFGVGHFDLLHAFPLIIGGMALCWLYDKYKNIWINITAHALWNIFSVYLSLSS